MKMKKIKKHKTSKIDNTDQQNSIEKLNSVMINFAREMAKEIKANAVLAYVDMVRSKENLKSLLKESRCILAVRKQEVVDELIAMDVPDDRIVRVPYINLSRSSRVKVAVLLALSKKLIQKEDRIICLSGSPKYGTFDNLTVLDVNRELEIFSSRGLDIANQIEMPVVFDHLLTIVMELAEEGKEGKPLGTTFVLGDHEKVMELSSQLVINPFASVPKKKRNIMDFKLKETLREFAAIDGAFVIRNDGVILAAGRHLDASADIADLPQGLGARHRSAAGITALSDAIALVMSESTGDVRIFSKGRIFMEIERDIMRQEEAG